MKAITRHDVYPTWPTPKPIRRTIYQTDAYDHLIGPAFPFSIVLQTREDDGTIGVTILGRPATYDLAALRCEEIIDRLKASEPSTVVRVVSRYPLLYEIDDIDGGGLLGINCDDFMECKN